jgi:hypothetical protein
MKTLFAISILLVFTACQRHPDRQPTVISLTYTQHDIQKTFDTLYNYQQASPGVYTGLLEQALAHCYTKAGSKSVITQDVFSSMYLNDSTNQYDCVTTTTFRFPKGTIAATGVFNLIPGDTIAPDHDFPITGGSAEYRDVYGTYTRKYVDGVYYVKLRFYGRD